jgi:damage-control phosphatase, subfamily III
MHSLFQLSKHWKTYDFFARQKTSSIRSSRPAIIELASRYKSLVAQIDADKASSQSKSSEEVEAAEKALFIEMCEICLWGNATDLSLLTNLSYVDFQKLQGSEARKASEKNIVVNDLSAAFAVLRKLQTEDKPERRVDIVLDNAGFELFVDLILAGYLLTAGLATTVVLHPKVMPWFVSDVVPADFSTLLNALAGPQAFYSTQSEDDKAAGKAPPKPLSDEEVTQITFLFEQWSQFHAEGKLVLRPNSFWTEGGSFWRLKDTAPELFDDLKTSELVIFKGDLNYRKLTGDVSTMAHVQRRISLTFLGCMASNHTVH